MFGTLLNLGLKLLGYVGKGKPSLLTGALESCINRPRL
jgi:hypothetical protein